MCLSSLVLESDQMPVQPVTVTKRSILIESHVAGVETVPGRWMPDERQMAPDLMLPPGDLSTSPATGARHAGLA